MSGKPSNQSHRDEGESVTVDREELWEIEKLLSHPRTRLDEDARYNDNWENRSRSKRGREDLDEAVDRLSDLRKSEEGST